MNKTSELLICRFHLCLLMLSSAGPDYASVIRQRLSMGSRERSSLFVGGVVMRGSRVRAHNARPANVRFPLSEPVSGK